MLVEYSTEDTLEEKETIELYHSVNWSSAEKPDQLLPALKNAHTLVTARVGGKLIGLGNAISDGHLVVYYPHLLVHPDYQNKGIGIELMRRLQAKYKSFHQQMLTADQHATAFYANLGFRRAGKTEPMWIYGGNDH
ncbi:GNAT family N-acetyltransferase [Puniceicoccaceae bacterium K14]|nr:GNAT family N-acetyltransferase [Puniceicoccaceae bacterium K14]